MARNRFSEARRLGRPVRWCYCATTGPPSMDEWWSKFCVFSFHTQNTCQTWTWLKLELAGWDKKFHEPELAAMFTRAVSSIRFKAGWRKYPSISGFADQAKIAWLHASNIWFRKAIIDAQVCIVGEEGDTEIIAGLHVHTCRTEAWEYYRYVHMWRGF